MFRKRKCVFYTTYDSASKLDNVSFITPWRTNVKIPSIYLKDAINSAKIAKQNYHNRNLSLGNLKKHRNYREKLSGHKAYYRSTNSNSWNELQTMNYYYWIDLDGNPNIEVKITANSYETLVFYLTIEEIDKFINVLSSIQQ